MVVEVLRWFSPIARRRPTDMDYVLRLERERTKDDRGRRVQGTKVDQISTFALDNRRRKARVEGLSCPSRQNEQASGGASEMTIVRQYHNEFSQKERRQVLRDALRGLSVTAPANTLHGWQQAEASVSRGRYGELIKHEVVQGGKQYPRASGPWHGQDNPVEPPLGHSVNDLEPCGTYSEIQASLGGTPPTVPSGVPPSPSHDVEPKVGVPAPKLNASHDELRGSLTGGGTERVPPSSFKRRF